MASIHRIAIKDDITGQFGAKTVSVIIDGKAYTIDMTAETFQNTLGPVLAKGTRVSAKGTKVKDKSKTKAIRAWGLANGHKVSPRGRLSLDLVKAYAKAH